MQDRTLIIVAGCLAAAAVLLGVALAELAGEAQRVAPGPDHAAYHVGQVLDEARQITIDAAKEHGR